jgi:hypothetical protein
MLSEQILYEHGHVGGSTLQFYHVINLRRRALQALGPIGTDQNCIYHVCLIVRPTLISTMSLTLMVLYYKSVANLIVKTVRFYTAHFYV